MRILKLFLVLALIGTAFCATRVPLIERFTNTACGYCPPCGDLLDSLWEVHGDNLTLVEVHVNWPSSSDPYYLDAPVASAARWNHYGVDGVPWVSIDGKSLSSWGTSGTEIDSRLATTTDLGLTAVATDSGILVTLDVEAPIAGTNNRLFVAVVQDGYYLPSAPNGEYYSDGVLKGIFPSETGQPVNLGTVGVQEIIVPVFPASEWSVPDCRIIVWVQNMSAATTGYNVHNSTVIDMPPMPYLFSFEPGVTSGVIWSDTVMYVLGDGLIENIGPNDDQYIMTIEKFLPAGWSASFCAGATCFPDSGIIDLAVGASADVTIDFYPGGPGSGSVRLNIRSVGSGLTLSATYKLVHTPSVLVVDDDLGSAYETYYSNSLTDLNESFFVHDLSAGDISGAELSRYEIVIWFTSADYSTVLSAADRTAIDAYLDGGGKMFMSSQDLGYYCDADGINSWYNNRFKATYFTDDSGVRTVTGSAGAIFAGLALDLFTGDGASFTPYPSTISPTGGSSACFQYGSGSDVAGVQYNGAWRIVYFAFPFEAIDGAATRDTVMNRTLTYLREGEDVAEGIDLPEKPLIVSASPNPFNSAVSLDFELSSDTDVTLDIFDLSGRRVARVIDEKLPLGAHSAVWNGRGSSEGELPSGVYFVKIKAGDKTATSKILLAK